MRKERNEKRRFRNRRTAISLLSAALALGVGTAFAAAPSSTLVGDWRVETEVAPGKAVAFDVAPTAWKTVVDEKYDALPTFNPSAANWARGQVLNAVDACECAVAFALDPASVVVKLAATGETLERGKDYQFDDAWSALGRLDGGKIDANAAVLISYRCVESRIDSLVLNADGSTEVLQGEPRVLSPQPPTLKAGQKRLVNIYATGQIAKLSDANVFPIDEAFAEANPGDVDAFVSGVASFNADPANGVPSVPSVSDVGAAKRYLPKTWAKLTSGEELRILAWGDSVTACGYIPDECRWQIRFVERLRKLFPQAKITLLTEAWGGRSSDSYRNEPPGSAKNYAEKVLALKPDLIISEFVNDAYMNEETVARRYGEMRQDFENIGAEWVIMGPHYVRPDWMGLTSERNCDDDPRQLTRGLRNFCADNEIPFADAPTLYGKLHRAGVPYLTLMTNNINHPDAFGMELFAIAAARLFEVGETAEASETK